MPRKTVTYARKNHVAYITLNRPEAGNAINDKLAQELADVCRQINQNDSIYAVVITGAGNRAFCGGSELERLVQAGATIEAASARLKDTGIKHEAAGAIASIDRPVIAVINGDALGQGLELALSCDIRLASPQARFGFPQVALGLIPMDGGTQRLSRIVGRGKALELILTGQTISAEEALAIGLVSKVVPPQDLAKEAQSLAHLVASKAPVALRFAKEAINQGLDLTLEQGLRLEADLYFLLHTMADRTEGIKAFLQKRPPKFRGK